MSSICSEDSKLIENSTKEKKNVPGDVRAKRKKTKIKKIESLKFQEKRKGSISATRLRNSEKKPSVVHIEIQPGADQDSPVRRSISQTGKKLHQNFSVNKSRLDNTESSSTTGSQTEKCRKNVDSSSIRKKFCKKIENSETEENIRISEKFLAGSSKFKIKAKSNDQLQDDSDKQSMDFHPFTAPSFGHRYSEDLKTEFEMRLADFAKRFSSNSCDKTSSRILFESGQTIEFGKDWVDRHIERYILLLMLQKLRAQTAKEKHSRSFSQSDCKEKISYPLFNSVVWTNPEENDIELKQNMELKQNICHTTGYLKNTLLNRKLLKQKELNQIKLLSNPPNEQSFFDIQNLFAIDKILSNAEDKKKQRGWSTTQFKRRHSTKHKSTSMSSSVDSQENELNLIDSFYEQNYNATNNIYKFRFTAQKNKKTGAYEPKYKFPNLPNNIWTALHPRPFIYTKSIPVNDREYEIFENSEKNTPGYLQPLHFEKKLLNMRFPVKEREYCKLVTVQNLVFDPDSTFQTK